MARSFIYLLLCMSLAIVATADDAFEPNNATNTAAAISPNVLYEDLECLDDDWYSINLSTSTRLDITIFFTHRGASTDIDLALHDSVGTRIGLSESADDDERIQTGMLSPGVYYIRVYGWEGATNVYDLRAVANEVEIVLPELLAVELPVAGATNIAATDLPLVELLTNVTAGTCIVTHNRTGYMFPIGGTEVTWTAWEGEPGASAVKAERTEYVQVFPFGQTPLGISDDWDGHGGHATAANHSPHVVRDTAGRIHTAWLDHDALGQGYRVFYRRGVQNQADGTVSWDNPVLVNGGYLNDRAFVAMAMSSNYVHFTWYGGSDQTCYRRMKLSETDFTVTEPVRVAAIGGNQQDNGPDIAVQGDDVIHIVTARGPAVYAYSSDGGESWQTEAVPVPSGGIKGTALAVDQWGNVHVTFTRSIRDGLCDSSQPGGGYWQLYYLRRQTNGVWVSNDGRDGSNGDVLAGLPGWRDPWTDGDVSHTNWDALVDWIDIEIDEANNIHLGWHGSVDTHIYGHDESHYLVRPCTGTETWGSWGMPINLTPMATYGTYSFCPSICVDIRSSLVLPVIFFGYEVADTSDCDSAVRVIRNGATEGGPVILSNTISNRINTWFPTAGPRLYRHANGRAWLDVLQTAVTPLGAPDVVVYQRYEVTDLLYPDAATNPAPAQGATEVPLNTNLSWSAANRAAWYDVYLGDSAVGVGSASPISSEYQGRQTGTVFSPTNLLSSGAYYWRIDTVNTNGTVTGDIWSFSTQTKAAYTIVVMAGAHGSVEPGGVVVVESGSNQTFDITASDYYHVEQVLVDGVSTGAVGSCTFTEVEAPHVLQAMFAENLLPMKTPEWWMVGHKLTNTTLEAEELLDADGDGMTNWKEYRAGTDPTNVASLLKVSEVGCQGENLVITWQSATGKHYTIKYATNLLDGFTGTLQSGIPANVPTNTYPVPMGSDGSCYYRIDLEE